MFERAGQVWSFGRYTTKTFPICWTNFARSSCATSWASSRRYFLSPTFNRILINSWSEMARFNSTMTLVDNPALPMVTIGSRWCAIAFSTFVSMTCICWWKLRVEVAGTNRRGFYPPRNNLPLVKSHSAQILLNSRSYLPGVVYWARKVASWYRVLGG